MTDVRSVATYSGKVIFFLAALLLVVLTIVWPYFNKSHRYEIKESQPTQSRTNSETPAPSSHKTNATPVDDIEEGEMVFNGQTQLIITPKE